jgi:hypothetical protein
MILGVDVGINGGYALINGNNELIECGKLPFRAQKVKKNKYKKVQDVEGTQKLFTSLKKAFNVSVAVIENVHPMAGQGVSSTGNFLKAAGVIEGLLKGLDFEVIKVSPRTWKKALEVDSDKKKSKALAETIFRTAFGTHDIAEAALLALYGNIVKKQGR